ncbi:hypothetical protein Tgr7_0053 [Thioalkalivibrio sulfidiphilus HL-EbGr7]|uniref:Oxygen tolerance n=1 Tax=Thioalkalivibrio sulfidiphilus (strain HL-EbGR7) TaxID=396588 RepID=B8GT97_THISH|nr:BatD family protein [Thioalkalivibrio sulfidiphilus]ACL71157.1 hypothetical protein Tgr7_0053 [Thioalkalivibrio sulfidiphilus HL-EbGr7]
MRRWRWRWLWVCLAALLLWAPAGADTPRLQVLPETTRLELGEPLILRLRAEHSAGDLFALDLSALDRDFDWRWEQRSRGSRGPDRVWARQELQLRLYARRSGELALPALALLDARSPPLTVQVQAPRRLGLALRAGLEHDMPFLREPVLAWLEIDTDHDQFELREPPRILSRAVHVEALGRSRERLADGRYRLRYQWLLTPLYPGELALPLDWLAVHDFQRQGVQLRYLAPGLRAQVRELPAYLPVDLPLAPIRASQRLEGGDPQGAEPLRGEPLLWVLDVRGRGLSPRALERWLARELTAPEGLRLHAPVIRQLDGPDLSPGERLLRVEVPVTPRAGGDHALPGLRLPWFDTGTGRLAVTELPALALTVRDPLRVLLWRSALALLGLALSLLMLWGLLAWLCRLRVRRALRAGIRQAADAPAMAAALRAVPGSPAALGRWLRTQRAGPALTRAVRALEVACYGQAGADREALRKDLLAALRGHRLVLPGGFVNPSR